MDQENNTINDKKSSIKFNENTSNYYGIKEMNQRDMSLGDPQNVYIKEYQIENNCEKMQLNVNENQQDQKGSQNIDFDAQLIDNNCEIQQNKKNMHQYDYLHQNIRQNNRTLSEPNMQLKKQKIISQISDVLIGISQSKLEDSFCQAINDIQNHIQTIQQRISVLEITFLNVSQKDQQVDQNKILADQSITEDRHPSLNSTNIHSRLCNKKDNFEKLVNDKLNSIQKQIEGVQETMEGYQKFQIQLDKIVNLWKTVGFINTKMEDLEILQLNTEELLKNNDEKTKPGFFKRNLFGF